MYADLVARSAEFGHMSAIVDSVLASPRRHELAATTSMHDLVVTDPPGSGDPEVVVVRAPGSLHQPPTGMVRIEHLSLTGHDEIVDRPAQDAVLLFGRFVREKFGAAGDDASR
jgi:hypothetical protein